MNTPNNSAPVESGHSSAPVYRKWYFGSRVNSLVLLRDSRSTDDPMPLPFEEVHEGENHTVGPPSTSADEYSNYGSFTIPEGADGKILYGTCSLFLGVDDWGSLEVRDSSGSIVAQVDLKENSQETGGQGGAQIPHGYGRSAAAFRHL